MINLIELTGGAHGPIGLQFVADTEREAFTSPEVDSLHEDRNEIAPGVIYKHRGKVGADGTILKHGRALFTPARRCSTYCRFCTRGREVGMPSDAIDERSSAALAHTPYLSDSQIDEAFRAIDELPELNEIILSGGDPLVAPPHVFEKVMDKLAARQRSGKLQIVRIGTRLPIHNPRAVADRHIERIAQLRSPYLMLHINHPAELTNEALLAIERLQQEAGAITYGQSVLLKGVNDDIQTLVSLFEQMVYHGIRPYYLLQNDPVPWAQHFTVPIAEAIRLWQEVRSRVSGLAATARFIIDVPGGKIPVPEGNSWNVDYASGFIDYKGEHHDLVL